MNDSADIRFLLTLRASGSLIAASRRLALSPSAVTQRLHIGELPLSNLVGYTSAGAAQTKRALGAIVKRIGVPESPDALSRLPCIVLRENNEDVSLWQFSKGRTRRTVRVSAHLSCNDGEVIRQWACEGRGVILRAEWEPRRAAFVAGSSYDMFGTAAVGLRTYWHNHVGLPLVAGAQAPEVEAQSLDGLLPRLATFGRDQRH